MEKTLRHWVDSSTGIKYFFIGRSYWWENNITASYLCDEIGWIRTWTTHTLHASFYHSRCFYLVCETEIIYNSFIRIIFIYDGASFIGSRTKYIWTNILYISSSII